MLRNAIGNDAAIGVSLSSQKDPDGAEGGGHDTDERLSTRTMLHPHPARSRVYTTMLWRPIMNLRRTTTRIMGILGASALMLSATIIPTEASTPQAASDCPSGWFCIFDYTGYGGRMLKFQNGGDLDQYGFRDHASSYVNNTRFSVRLTDYHWYGDDHLTVAAGARSSDMGGWSNRVDRVHVNN